MADTRRSRAPRGGDVWSRHACEDCCSLLEPGGCGCVREWQFLLRLATPSASPWASACPPASRGTSTALVGDRSRLRPEKPPLSAHKRPSSTTIARQIVPEAGQNAIHCAWWETVPVTRDTYEGRSEQGKALSKKISTGVSWRERKNSHLLPFLKRSLRVTCHKKGPAAKEATRQDPPSIGRLAGGLTVVTHAVSRGGRRVRVGNAMASQWSQIYMGGPTPFL